VRADRPELVAWAAANGYWQAVPLLIEHGFDVNATHNGTTPLHRAAAAPLSIVKLLVESGADTENIDDVFHQTPLGWARHLRRRRIVAYLRSKESPGPTALERHATGESASASTSRLSDR
jgi:ankyrin repeat protein